MIRQDLRAAAPALALALALLLPFLHKPFTIDDAFFLAAARHALEDPLHPMAVELPWDGRIARASAVAPTGPVMAWLLVPVHWAGGAEWPAHALVLALLCAALVATASLARRLGADSGGAALAAALVASSPAVLGMAGTAMPDVAAMALGVLGVERLVAAREARRPGAHALAIALLAGAALTRTHLLPLVVPATLLAARPALRAGAWRPLAGALAAPAAAVVGAFAVVLLVTRDPVAAGGNVVSAAAGLLSAEMLGPNALVFLGDLALTTPLVLGWIVVRGRAILGAPAAIAAALVVAAAAALAAHAWRPIPWGILPVAALSAVALADAIAVAAARRDAVTVGLVLWLLLPLAALPYFQMAAKYLVAAAPAAALLVAREAASRVPSLRRALALACVALGVALGAALLRADARLAAVARDGASTLIRPAVEAGRRVFYLGDWGFQWYAERAGARPLLACDPRDLGPGDLFAEHLQTTWTVQLTDVVHVGRVEDRTPGGRVMSRAEGAGFYSSVFGYLPWTWGEDVVDAVDLWMYAPPPR